MDDLISRKKALDMIRLYERDEDIDIDELESSIAMLPSEQSKTQLSTEDTTLDTTFDCISRAAAINAADMADYPGLSIEDVDKVTGEVVKALKELPSVQPEIIRCNSCRHDNNCAIQDIAQTGGKFFCGFARQKGEEDG